MSKGDPIDRAFLIAGDNELQCSSISIKGQNGKDWVEAMTRDNEPLGLAGGNMKYDVDVEAPMTEGQSDDVDLHELMVNGTNVEFVVEAKNGDTYTWAKGQVVSVDSSFKTGVDGRQAHQARGGGAGQVARPAAVRGEPAPPVR